MIFSNQSDGEARVEVARIADDNKTIQDLEEDIRDRPEGYRAWVVGAGFWGKTVDPGEIATMTTRTTQLACDYGMICDRIPHFIVFGSGFTLVK